MHQGYLQHGDHLWLLFDHLSEYAAVAPAQNQHLLSSVALLPAAHDGVGVGQITLCQVCKSFLSLAEDMHRICTWDGCAPRYETHSLMSPLSTRMFPYCFECNIWIFW